MNKKYRNLSIILLIGYGFFFTTRLWNVDDRPRFNSWEMSTMGTNHGRIAITEVVYSSPIDAIDIMLEKMTFVSDYEFVLEAVVHRLDGSTDVVEMTVLDEESNLNVTRQLVRITLADDNLAWHYVEIALIDEATGERSRLTMDWRLIKRVDEVTTATDYDLTFEQFGVIESETDNDDFTFPEHQAPDLSLVALENSLDIALLEYAIISQSLEVNPDDEIMRQSLAYYESEIERLEALIQEQHDEN